MDSDLKQRKNRGKSSEKTLSKIAEENRPLIRSSVDRTLARINEKSSESETEESKENSRSDKSKEKSIEKQSKESKISDDRNLQQKQPRIAIHHTFRISFDIDLISIALFLIALFTRFYRLSEPNNIVFDELHFGKYVSLYMKRLFFFDQHPPLGKQLIGIAAYLGGYNGNYTFSRIGSEYTENIPIFWLRVVPAICGSILVPLVYQTLLQLKLKLWTACLGGCLILLENTLITQSQFILMEPMLLVFSILGILMLLKYQESYDKLHQTTVLVDRTRIIGLMFWYAVLSAIFFTCAICIKYVAFYTCMLGVFIGCRHFWQMLSNRENTNISIGLELLFRTLIFSIIPLFVYLMIFWIHLSVLNKAGPHDSIMTSAFQASLAGGLASITKGQPLKVAHGSQITLRHTHGRTCWLHSHAAVYPVRYPDKRGSSHQQQVTCYSFKDVNNWWIVKKPNKTNLVVENHEIDAIKHGDEVQLVHGITSRALNSHDVASPMTPHSQEVSCYIDYNISMPGQLLWKVDILNRERDDDVWHTIKSQIRLIHVGTSSALRFTGRQLPDWGYNQHEVVADRNFEQLDTIWNVEEHRYTKTADQRERERQMVTAEMIPTKPTTLSFFEKFAELQYKMLWSQTLTDASTHMYGSYPLDWPFMSKGIAYWVDAKSNAQIHLIGNIIIWYSGTYALIIYITLLAIYLLRRRRQCFDIDAETWARFCQCGEVLFGGYLIHFIPYFFVERSMFLHNYLPALVFKIMLLCFVIEHLYVIIRQWFRSQTLCLGYISAVMTWLAVVLFVFKRFSILSYGISEIDGRPINADDILSLRWKDTWDFILHKELS